MITALFSNKTTGIASYFQQTTFTSGSSTTLKVAETFSNEYLDIETIYQGNGGGNITSLVVYDKSIGAVVGTFPTSGVTSPGIFYSQFNEDSATYLDGGASGGVKIQPRKFRLGPNCELRFSIAVISTPVVISVTGVRTYVSP